MQTPDPKHSPCKDLGSTKALSLSLQHTKQGSSSEEGTDVLNEESSPEATAEQAEAENQALLAQLTAIQEAHKELCAELQRAEDDYNMATGSRGCLWGI